MGKKRYDSYPDAHRGGGHGGPGMRTRPKNKMPMATDTRVANPDSYRGAGATVTESRLNSGGDRAWKGKRTGTRAKAGAYSRYG